MRIVDARAMPIDHEDVIAVTPLGQLSREERSHDILALSL